MSWNAAAFSNPTPPSKTASPKPRAAWTALSSAPSTPSARNSCAAAPWRRASIRSFRNSRNPTPCASSPASFAVGSSTVSPSPPPPCPAPSRALPGAPTAIAASRSTKSAKPPGTWPNGAISTRPGPSDPSPATPTWRPSSIPPRPPSAYPRAAGNCRRTSAPCANSSSVCSARAKPDSWTPPRSRVSCSASPSRCVGSKAATPSAPPGKS